MVDAKRELLEQIKPQTLNRDQEPRVFGVNVVIGIPSWGMVSHHFAQALAGQQFPLVSSTIPKWVVGKKIAEARNEVVEFALSQGAKYIYWLDDDVIAPPDAFLKMFNHNKDIINGVYWSKSNPPMPLLFRNHLSGPYYNWHVGDLVEIDAAGNGLTLVKTDVYRKIGEPWYSTEYSSFPGVTATPYNNTEDLYFYWKARKAGYKVWADTSIQAFHYDKTNNVSYTMPMNAPQAMPAWEIKKQGEKLVADIGSGPVSPYFEEGPVISFDIREDVRPDVVCDVRHLPVPDQTFDIVFSSHTLEHFPWMGVESVLKEWTRVLKVGGELRLVVPNLRFTAKRLLDDTVIPHDFWVLFGEQDYGKNYHASGFTPRVLQTLVESLGAYSDVKVREGNIDGPPDPNSWNLQLKATKTKHLVIDNITPDSVLAGPPSENVIPVRLYSEYNIREMTSEEIATELVQWMGPDAANGIKPNKEVLVEPTEQAGGFDLLFEEQMKIKTEKNGNGAKPRKVKKSPPKAVSEAQGES